MSAAAAALVIALVASLGITPPRAARAQTLYGVDVSSFQGSINWSEAAASGISFAYIRAGVGESNPDLSFRPNWTAAGQAGVLRGAYLYFHPADDPQSEANLLINQLASVGFGGGSLVPAIDVETTDGLPPASVASQLAATVADVENWLGQPPAIYASPTWWDDNVASGAFTSDPLWVANWGVSSPGLPANGWGGHGWRVWQYTDAGSVAGINGAVDMDQSGAYPMPLVGPSGTVSTLPATESATSFNVCWTITGTGAAHTVVWEEPNNGAWSEYTDTTALCTTFFGRPGTTYGFAVQVFDQQNHTITPFFAQPDTSTTVSSNATSGLPFKSMYVVDGAGLLHVASSPLLQISMAWFGQDVARGVYLDGDGLGGQVLDGFGGLHYFGNASGISSGISWPEWAIARGFVMRSDEKSGYILDGFGGVHPFGGAPAVTSTGYWPNWDIARAIVLRSNGGSGYVLDGFGGLHPFAAAGFAMPSVPVTAYWPNWDIAKSLVLLSSGVGGYTLDGFGGVHAFGGAAAIQNPSYWPNWDIARAIVLVNDTQGYLVDGLCGVHPLGTAPSVVTPFQIQADTARGVSVAR